MYASYPYDEEHSCQKAKKSYARFSGKIGNQLTDQPTNQRTITTLTSTDVENCNVLKDLLNVRNIKKSRIRNKKFRKSEIGKSEYQKIKGQKPENQIHPMIIRQIVKDDDTFTQ